METVQIRLPKTTLKKIDQTVRDGIYRSRSEAIRDALGRIETLSLFEAFRRLVEQEGVDKEALLKETTKMRKHLYQSYL